MSSGTGTTATSFIVDYRSTMTTVNSAHERRRHQLSKPNRFAMIRPQSS
jgi:hypothetical protein